jgi:hypothetical protein
MAEMSWRNIMRRFVRNVMTGSFTNAVRYIVKSAVNRKLSNRNVIGSSTAASSSQHHERQTTIESSTDESHQQAGLPTTSAARKRRPNKFTVKTDTALEGKAITKHIFPKNTITDEVTFLKDVKRLVCGIFKQNRNTKIKMELICQMAHTNMLTGEDETSKGLFRSETLENNPATCVHELYEDMKRQIENEFANYLGKSSGWRLKEVLQLNIKIDVNRPLRGSSYVELPKFIKNKKAVINIQNTDNECFKWCVLRALNPVNKNAARISDLMKINPNVLNWGDITFPVKLRDIDKFERLNPKYAINVYAIENGKEIYTLRVSKLIPPDEGCYINLLLHENHYSLVNNFGRLINSQMSNHKGTRFHCYRCLNSFTNENALKDHTEYCKTHAPVKTILADKPVEFTNFNRSMRVPFVIYADFETFNKNQTMIFAVF